MDASTGRLTAYSHGAGCACKLGAGELAQALGSLTPPRHPDLIVGRDGRDDALVWRRPDGRALVATIDVFTPIVDDPDTWGRIAAMNAVSDVYAMGATPLFGLAMAAWPRDVLPLELLGRVLAAGQDAAEQEGWIVAGGHTIDGPEPLYGQAVIGEVDADRVLTNAGARAGDALVLTKAIGTGLVTTAHKRREPQAIATGGDLHDLYGRAVASMLRSNRPASQAAIDAGAHAMTDVSGFGLLGHAHELAAASGVAIRLDAAAVPRLDGIDALVASGEIPGGTRRNLADARVFLDGDAAEADLLVLADAQTSGGLLIALAPAAAADLAAGLCDDGHAAAIVGAVAEGPPGRIAVG
jgi:selenide, water dikinase